MTLRTYIGLAFSLITVQKMFREVGHLLMASVQTNVLKVTSACFPDDEAGDVATQIQCASDP